MKFAADGDRLFSSVFFGGVKLKGYLCARDNEEVHFSFLSPCGILDRYRLSFFHKYKLLGGCFCVDTKLFVGHKHSGTAQTATAFFSPLIFAGFKKRSIFVPSVVEKSMFIRSKRSACHFMNCHPFLGAFRHIGGCFCVEEKASNDAFSTTDSANGNRFFVAETSKCQSLMKTIKKTLSGFSPFRQLLNIVLLGCMSISLLFVGASYSGVPKWAALALNLSFGVLFLLSFVFMLVANSAKKGGAQ
ncbi:MAG: hypothetical protein SPI35_06010 [Porphyromonas sp.]|nr:hypothetical protein [Porphyromonas sp.]